MHSRAFAISWVQYMAYTGKLVYICWQATWSKYGKLELLLEMSRVEFRFFSLFCSGAHVVCRVDCWFAPRGLPIDPAVCVGDVAEIRSWIMGSTRLDGGLGFAGWISSSQKQEQWGQIEGENGQRFKIMVWGYWLMWRFDGYDWKDSRAILL